MKFSAFIQESVKTLPLTNKGWIKQTLKLEKDFEKDFIKYAKTKGIDMRDSIDRFGVLITVALEDGDGERYVVTSKEFEKVDIATIERGVVTISIGDHIEEFEFEVVDDFASSYNDAVEAAYAAFEMADEQLEGWR